MPADLRYETLRAMVEITQRRVRSIERNEGIAFVPGTRNPANPLDADVAGGSQMLFAEQQASGYDAACGLTILPFTSDFSVVPLASGTATAGGASTITLAVGSSAVNDFYAGSFITLIGGTGCGQIVLIASYVGATRVATVDTAWAVVPDNTTQYVIGSEYELVMA
jgi:hypothetical protein